MSVVQGPFIRPILTVAHIQGAPSLTKAVEDFTFRLLEFSVALFEKDSNLLETCFQVPYFFGGVQGRELPTQ